MATILSKVQALRAELEGLFPEREAEIRSLLVATVAREHVLLLGPPGTAKSALVRAFCAATTDASYFEWLLTRFSPPEEILGPVGLSALKQDRFTRVTAGKLPEAHVAFLDEIFKANSAILNALLSAANERVFYDDGKPRPIPLLTIVGASNELPKDDLSAFYDRFMLRHWVAPIQARESFRGVLRAARNRACTSARHEPKARLTLGDWTAAQGEAAQVAIGDETLDRLWDLRRQLAEDGITISSDRRWVKALSIVAASAWLDGQDEVSPEDFAILAHALWQEPEQAAAVRRVVATFSAPELAEATEIHDALGERVRALPPATDAGFEAAVAATNRDIRRGLERIRALHSATRSKRAKQQIAALGKTLQGHGKNLRAALLGENDLATEAREAF